jgi:energy-coupling factor transporter transmembrane protein EcfT
MKVLNPQSPQTADVSRGQIVKSKLQGLKGFFRISEGKDKSPFQYICIIIGIIALFACIFWYDDWYAGAITTEIMMAIAFLAFLAIGTYIGGKPTILVVFSLIMVFGFSYFLISGKTPVGIGSNKEAEKLPPYEHSIVFDKNSVGSPGHSKRFKHDRSLRVIVENGPVKAIFGNNISVVLVPGQHPATVKKGEILGFESLGESKITIINDP